MKNERKIMTNESNKATSWWHSLPGIITAIAGLISAITGMIIGLNQLGVFSDDSTNMTIKNKCTEPWQWDVGRQSCVISEIIPGKTYSIPLKRQITKVDGRIDIYLNTVRLKGTDSHGRAMYSEKRGAIQAVIPIMYGSTLVGDLHEIIYSTGKGEICNISNLSGTTGWLKKMKVDYSTLLSDCGNLDKTCSAKLDSSKKRVHIRTKQLTVVIAKKC